MSSFEVLIVGAKPMKNTEKHIDNLDQKLVDQNVKLLEMVMKVVIPESDIAAREALLYARDIAEGLAFFDIRLVRMEGFSDAEVDRSAKWADDNRGGLKQATH